MSECSDSHDEQNRTAFEHRWKSEINRLRKEALVTFTPALIIFAIVLSGIAVAQIIMGAVYLNGCPVEPMIPIYLIGLGAGILGGAVIVRLCACRDAKGRPRNPLIYLIFLFLIVWFIAGNIWVFKNYLPNMDYPERPKYCSKALFLFTFWSKIAQYVAFVSWVIIAYVVIIRPVRIAKKIVTSKVQAWTDDRAVQECGAKDQQGGHQERTAIHINNELQPPQASSESQPLQPDQNPSNYTELKRDYV